MNNLEKKSKVFWKKQSKKGRDLSRHNDTQRLVYDIKYIKKFTNIKPKKILDLGSGTGQLSISLNKIYQNCNFTLVDNNKLFLNFNKKNKFKKILQNILKFKTKEKYDLILLYGVVNYLSKKNTKKIYLKINEFLNTNGIAFIRHQCGITKEIYINKFSKKLEEKYIARYPDTKQELILLKKIFTTKKIAYPKKLNLHKNTKHYLYICKKK